MAFDEAYLLIEDRFGLISEKVPRIFKPQLVVKNLSKQEVEFLRGCKNPKGFPLPPSEPEVPQAENYTLNVFFRLAYPKGVDFSKSYLIEEFEIIETEPVEFEMKFLAGKVPFIDISRIYWYKLKPLY